MLYSELRPDQLLKGAAFIEPHNPNRSGVDNEELIAYQCGQLAIIQNYGRARAVRGIHPENWSFTDAGMLHEQCDFNEAVAALITATRNL